MRYLALGIVVAALGAAALIIACRPNPPQPTPPLAPALVTPAELAREYRDQIPGRTRDGQRVRVDLPPRSYLTVPGVGVAWFVADRDKPPTILFHCRPPADDSRYLELTGTVRGADRDDTDRGAGVRFTLNIEDCAVVSR